MIRWLQSIALPLTAAAIVALGCDGRSPVGKGEPVGKTTTIDDVHRESGEALSTAQQYAFERKEEYMAKATQAWNDLSRKFDEQTTSLKARLSSASNEAKPKIEQQLKELEERKSKAKAQYERMKSSGSDAWAEVKTGVSRSFDELKDGLQKASDELKK